MKFNEKIINELKQDLGFLKAQKAEQAYANNKVKIESIDLNWNYEIITLTGYVIDGTTKKNNIQVRLNLAEGGKLYAHNCTCNPYSYKECEHILAVILEFSKNQKYIVKINETIEKARKEEEKYMFNNIINKFKYEEESIDIEDVGKDKTISTLNNNIEIIPVIKKSKYGEYELSFKLGENKMYKLKSLEEFYKNYSNGNVYKYGEKLAFKHTEETFLKSSKDYLDFILKYGQAIYLGNLALENKNVNYTSRISSSSLVLKDKVVDDFLEILKNKPNTIELDGKNIKLHFLNGIGNIKFNLEEVIEGEYRLSINKNEIKILNGLNTIYTICDNNVYEYDRNKYTDVFRLISMFDSRNKTEFNFESEELIEFINNVLPRIRDNIKLDGLPESVREKYVPKKLGVKVYLDLTNKGDVLATVKFCYDDIEFEPYSNNIPKIPRDTILEKKVLDKFINDGFIYSRNYESFIMTEEDKIYNFIVNSINYYMENYEVLISEEFKKREIRQPRIATLGVKIQNNLLNIDLSGLEFDAKELKDILEKYKLKKKYYRLKTGEFLSLEQNDDLDFIEDLAEGMDIDYTSLSKGKIKIPVNRSLYFNKLIENLKNVEITEDKTFKELVVNTENGKVDEEIVIPEELETTLRPYQKTGYKWLKVLDKYRFGGILADDMGLRKNFASYRYNIIWKRK